MMSYDKEEGEIDSDEGELRKRIEELENENKEYEQIARLSESYASAYQYCKRNVSLTLPPQCDSKKFPNMNWRDIERAGQVPTDASSISSVEFLPPKKRKRKKSKGSRSKSYVKHSRSHGRRQGQKHCKTTYQNRKRHHIEQNFIDGIEIETISLDSSGSLGHDKNEYQCAPLSTDEEEYDNIVLPLSREELRLALARSESRDTTVGTLKERLEREKRIKNSLTMPCDESEEVKTNNVDSDESVSLEEQELRLIALRSAIIKKDLTRKKRNAEVAYSPTDFEELLLDSASAVETDLDDLPGEMEVSPVASPRLLLSPVPCDEHSTSSIRSNVNNVDTKPVDMDIANSDSEADTPSYLNQNSSSCGQWQPTSAELIPLPAEVGLSGGNTSTVFRYANAETPGVNSKYVAKIDIKSTVQRPSPLPIPPPELSAVAHLHSGTKWVKGSRALSPLAEGVVKLRSNARPSTLDRSSPENSMECSYGNDPDSDEEKALRAFLLSKIQKNVKDSTAKGQVRKSRPHAETDVPDDCHSNAMRSLLFARNFDQTVTKGPSESILKEAVRRLKVKTCAEKLPTEFIRFNGNNFAEMPLPTQTVEKTAFDRKSSKEWKSITNIERKAMFTKKHENCENFNVKNLSEVERKHLDASSSDVGIEKDVNTDVDGVCGSLDGNAVTEVKVRAESDVLKPLPNELARNTSCSVNGDLKVSSKSSDVEKEKCSPPRHHTDAESELRINKLAGAKSQSTPAPLLMHLSKPKGKPESSFYSLVNPKKSSKPIFRPIKIVKPHKVINTSSALKSKLFDNFMATSKNLDSALTNNASSGSRVITARKLSDCKMDKLIITLGTTDTESDEEVELYRKAVEKSILSACVRSNTPDSLAGVINDDCFAQKNDVACASTKSVSLTASKVETSNVSGEMMKMSETFENKLDNFLRDVRSKVQNNSVSDGVCKPQNGNVYTNQTPKAVRHLPVASQEEYKRLVHRMQMLEKQKHFRKSQSFHDPQVIILSNKCGSALNIPTIVEPLQGPNEGDSKSSKYEHNSLSEVLVPTSKSPISIEKSTRKSLIKKVLAKNATKKNVTEVSKDKEIPDTLKLTDQLKAYESSFLGISANIVGNLDRSLRLVTEAKNAKIAKMRCTRRLKELRMEMEETQHKLKDEQDKMSKIYPQICYSNEVITTLKQTRSKILEAATKLGKNIKGDEYRLDNELKNEITIKSKSLAAEIKFVNSITCYDLDKFEKDLNIVSSKSLENKNEIRGIESIKHVSTVIETHEMLEEKRNFQDNSTNKQQTSNTEQKCKILAGKPLIEQQEAQEAACEHSGQSMEKDFKDENNKDQTGSGEHVITCAEEKIFLPKYVSPLTHLRSAGSRWDPSGVICPYELMGQCEDKDCRYVHLTERETVLADG